MEIEKNSYYNNKNWIMKIEKNITSHNKPSNWLFFCLENSKKFFSIGMRHNGPSEEILQLLSKNFPKSTLLSCLSVGPHYSSGVLMLYKFHFNFFFNTIILYWMCITAKTFTFNVDGLEGVRSVYLVHIRLRTWSWFIKRRIFCISIYKCEIIGVSNNIHLWFTWSAYFLLSYPGTRSRNTLIYFLFGSLICCVKKWLNKT